MINLEAKHRNRLLFLWLLLQQLVMFISQEWASQTPARQLCSLRGSWFFLSEEGRHGLVCSSSCSALDRGSSFLVDGSSTQVALLAWATW